MPPIRGRGRETDKTILALSGRPATPVFCFLIVTCTRYRPTLTLTWSARSGGAGFKVDCPDRGVHDVVRERLFGPTKRLGGFRRRLLYFTRIRWTTVTVAAAVCSCRERGTRGLFRTESGWSVHRGLFGGDKIRLFLVLRGRRTNGDDEKDGKKKHEENDNGDDDDKDGKNDDKDDNNNYKNNDRVMHAAATGKLKRLSRLSRARGILLTVTDALARQPHAAARSRWRCCCCCHSDRARSKNDAFVKGKGNFFFLNKPLPA